MEAAPRFELGVKALQASALPLGYAAKYWVIRTEKMERKTRFELATLALARRCSTTEPFPHIFWCPKPESNQRHVNFQSTALPTELFGLILGLAIFQWPQRIVYPNIY